MDITCVKQRVHVKTWRYQGGIEGINYALVARQYSRIYCSHHSVVYAQKILIVNEYNAINHTLSSFLINRPHIRHRPETNFPKH